MLAHRLHAILLRTAIARRLFPAARQLRHFETGATPGEATTGGRKGLRDTPLFDRLPRTPPCGNRRRQGQSSSWVKQATPRLVQYFSSCCLELGSMMVVTKFVLWPDVESVPLRSEVL